MSLRPGSSDQPECVATFALDRGAQAGQRRAPSLTNPHQGQVCVAIAAQMSNECPTNFVCRSLLSNHLR